MSEALTRACPRCHAVDCIDPDSKECSDNCITALRREIERLRAERDEVIQRILTKDHHITRLTKYLAQAEQERKRLREDLEAMARSRNAYKEIAADMEQERNEAEARLAQAEQREARLREALDNLVRRCGRISYPTDPSAIEWNAAIEQAQQALSQSPPAT